MRSPGPRGHATPLVFAPLNLGHLIERKLDRSLAAEDGDHDLHLAGIGRHLGHHAVELGERDYFTVELLILVAMRLGETPVHIPNTMVKTQTADDTILETVWESRWLPDLKQT